MEEMKSRLLLVYILMLIAHQVQVFEELWSRSYLVIVLGDDTYILANLLLFCVPMVILYFLFMEKKWAYYLSVAYAVFMMYQGIERLVFLFVGGTPSITQLDAVIGVIVFVVGIPMVYYLYLNIERFYKQNDIANQYRALIKTY